jgi:hypothetical protein
MVQEIQPGAVVNSTWDMDRSRFENRWQYAIKDGVNIMNEATFLAMVQGADGGQVVLPCTGVTDEIFAGVALHSGIHAYVWADVVRATIPAVAGPSGNYEVDIGHKNLKNDGGSPKTAYVRVKYAATGAAFTIFDESTAPTGDGEVQVDPDTGIFTFWGGVGATDPGKDVIITYRWDLSAVERDILARESNINRGAELFLQEMMVGTGHCIVYTMMYDATADWVELSTLAGDQPCLGPNGEVTTINKNATGTVIGRVISAPSVDDPFLGIEYTTL